MNLDGVLFFPVTAFAADGHVDAGLTAEHVRRGLAEGAGAVFASCGTGEFHALSALEVGNVAAAAVAAVEGQVPVFSGAGGPTGHAVECARHAQEAGADGILLLPPYLVAHTVSGTLRYIDAVLAATTLPVVVYHRASAMLTADAARRLASDPRIVGIKDGVGDVGLAHEIVRAVRGAGRSDLAFFNGLPTAEVSQLAYRALGISLYSSAAFAMAPRVARAFYDAYLARDDDRCTRLLDSFYLPLVRLRDQSPGFAIALIKAGVRLGGLPVGPVRAPLVDPNAEQLGELERILSAGRELVESW